MGLRARSRYRSHFSFDVLNRPIRLPTKRAAVVRTASGSHPFPFVPAHTRPTAECGAGAGVNCEREAACFLLAFKEVRRRSPAVSSDAKPLPQSQGRRRRPWIQTTGRWAASVPAIIVGDGDETASARPEAPIARAAGNRPTGRSGGVWALAPELGAVRIRVVIAVPEAVQPWSRVTVQGAGQPSLRVGDSE